MNWINSLITFIPLLFFIFFLAYFWRGRFFGNRSYNQMMDENFQRLNMIEKHVASMATSLEQIAAEMKNLTSKLPEQ